MPSTDLLYAATPLRFRQRGANASLPSNRSLPGTPRCKKYKTVPIINQTKRRKARIPRRELAHLPCTWYHIALGTTLHL
eukprot:729087-Rhodomonas_salina.2